MILQIPFVHHKIIFGKTKIAIGILWLFQISAIIGISIGFKEWFVQKTSLNLILQLGLLMWVFPVKHIKNFALFSVIFLAGMLVEILGVKTGVPFGDYQYGSNLGIKVFDVPLLIGCNWAILVFVGASIANIVSKNIWIKSLIGASLMVLLDLPMEVIAPTFDYWTFTNTVPLKNYLSWFVIGFLMHLLVQRFKLEGNTKYSIHLYLGQLFFFLYFCFVL